MKKYIKIALFLAFLFAAGLAWAQIGTWDQSRMTKSEREQLTKKTAGPDEEGEEATDADVDEQAEAIAQSLTSQLPVDLSSSEVRYTLGPDDLIEITVLRHPEFSGNFPVNGEGKIQYKYVGDIEVNGLTKKELEAKLTQTLSKYVNSPEVTVNILEYRSKVYYVIGEVGRPGKFFMRSEAVTVREAVMEAGLPTFAASMRKCRLITPAKKGKVKTKSVDLYSILYGGNLKRNYEMHSGDVLYVPATVMAKVFRVIAPITAPVTSAASATTGVDTIQDPTPYQ